MRGIDWCLDKHVTHRGVIRKGENRRESKEISVASVSVLAPVLLSSWYNLTAMPYVFSFLAPYQSFRLSASNERNGMGRA